MSKILHLNNRTVLSLKGPDSLKYLQGLITNDTNNIEFGRYIYAFLLSPQGRFLYDFFITLRDDEVLIDCPASKSEEIFKKLNMYKLRSDLTIYDRNKEYKIYYSDQPINDYSYLDPRIKTFGYRTICNCNYQDSISKKDYDIIRMNKIIPDADMDFIYDKSLVLEFGGLRLNAINMNKGCYIGQEVVSRMNYRSNVRKQLYLINFDCNSPFKGEELIINDKKIGIFLGSVDNISLGLLNIDEVNKLNEISYKTLSRNISINKN